MPFALKNVGMGQLTTKMDYDNLKIAAVYNSGAETRRSYIVREATNY